MTNLVGRGRLLLLSLSTSSSFSPPSHLFGACGRPSRNGELRLILLRFNHLLQRVSCFSPSSPGVCVWGVAEGEMKLHSSSSSPQWPRIRSRRDGYLPSPSLSCLCPNLPLQCWNAALFYYLVPKWGGDLFLSRFSCVSVEMRLRQHKISPRIFDLVYSAKYFSTFEMKQNPTFSARYKRLF